MAWTGRLVVSAAVVIAAGACATSAEPRDQATPDASVFALVEVESLRHVQRVDVLLDIPSEQTQVFRVVYGDSFPVPGYCQHGCGYAFPSAVGLKVKSHVGWLLAADTSLRRRFDVLPTDAYLFTDDFFARFEQAEVILFQQPFKSLLATDGDTPEPALSMLVQGLATWINSSLATRLLDNPHVAGNRELLRRIAELPVSQGDAYKAARERAARMLAGTE